MPTIRNLGILTAALCTPLAYGAGPSFDCAKASHEIEHLVCADDGLAALDRRMAEVYATALKNYPQRELKTLKATQRGWIKGRNDCWKADDQRACAESEYLHRITELQITGGELVVPAPVRYVCDGGPYDYLTAVYYRDTAIPAVVLTHIGGAAGSDGQSILFLQPSGSGAKYQGGNTLFWEHHGEATLETGEQKSTCKVQSPD